MSKYIPSEYLDWLIDRIQESTHVSICSQQPTNGFHCRWGSLRINNTSYTIGGVVRPSTINGFIYECIVGGLSGGSEPIWPVVDEDTVEDNEVTWKARETFSLATSELYEIDWDREVQAAATLLTFLGKNRVTAHNTGVPTHTALFSEVDNKIRYVTTTSFSNPEDTIIEIGRVVNINSFFIERGNLL